VPDQRSSAQACFRYFLLFVDTKYLNVLVCFRLGLCLSVFIFKTTVAVVLSLYYLSPLFCMGVKLGR
jgi:hypothetical protein